MRDWDKVRQRYTKDDWPIRLGNLASSLARISDWSRRKGMDDTVKDILHETTWFIEWGAPQTPIEILRELAPMQRELCLWRRLWPIEEARPMLALRARIMSDRVLELSGLLPNPFNPLPTALRSGDLRPSPQRACLSI